MKQVKFLLVALMTVLMGVSVSSCMKSGDNDTTVRGFAVALCTNSYPPTFTLSSGQKMVISDATLTDVNSGTFYAFYFQFDSAVQSSTSASVNVTLYNGSTPVSVSADYDENPREIAEEAALPANAPMHTLKGYASGLGEITPEMFSNDYIIIPVVFWIKTESDETKQKEELAKHSFEFTYKKSEMKDGELVLTLNHVINDPVPPEGEEIKEVVRDRYTYDYKAYSLMSAVNAYTTLKGSAPTKITIKAVTNTSKNSLKDNVTTQTASFPYPVK